MSNQVGCTPTSSIGEISCKYSSMCICCMAITTPCIASIIRLPLVSWSFIAMWDFLPFGLPNPHYYSLSHNILVPKPNAYAHRLSRLWNSWLMTFMFILLDWILLCCEIFLDAWYWRIELLHWILKTPLINLVWFHAFKASFMKTFSLFS